MQINIIAIGTKMTSWVNEGYQDYAVRLPREWHLNLIELPAKKRFKSSSIKEIIHEESQQLQTKIPAHHYVIALERQGISIDSQSLAKKITTWQLEHQSISFLIGGPEGLSEECCQRADAIWSLSKLTLPHPLVRIVLVEQLYRAYTILNHHPYHR